jgi:hypothetical protein
MVRATRSLMFAIAVICLASLTVWAPSSSAQIATAQVVGRVVDAQGGSVTGATIKMIETLKGDSHNTVTDSEGHYTFPALPVGPYRFEVSKDGFKTYSQTGIILQVDDHIELPAKLEVGAAAQVIEVNAGATMVQTETAAISNVIDSQRINDLPLNGRFASQLIVLSGAAVMFQGQTSTSGFGDLTGSKNFYSSFAVSVAGSALNGTNYLLDGGDNVDTYSNVNLPFPFPDALQEFSVETSALPARSGLHPGGVVNVVTKSGTNELHGDAFDYLRNGVFNARAHFSPTGDTVHRNQFGGTVGDKILKDKLFFFLGYQGTRLDSIGTQSASVPTAAMWAGDFTAYVQNGCGTLATQTTSQAAAQGITGMPIFNLAPGAVATFSNGNLSTGTPSTTNTLIKNVSMGSATTGLITLNPAFAFNASSLALKPFLPVAGATFNGSPNPCGQINYALPTINDGDEIIGRVDYVLSSKHRLFGRYYINDFNSPPPFSPTNLILTQNPGLAQRAQTFTLGDSYAISPSKINSFHFTWNRRRDDRGVNANDINPTAPISSGGLGINEFNYLGNFFLISSISGGQGGFVVGCGTCATGHFNVNGIQAADDFDIIRGKHHFAFGIDVHHSQNNTVSGFDGNGTYAFAASTASVPGLGYFSSDIGLADFLLGNYSGYSFSRPQAVNYASTIPGVYFQDTMRVTNTLTVTAGLRWEPSLYPTDEFNRGAVFNMADFLADVHSVVQPNAPAGFLYYGDAGVPRSFASDHLQNLSPRLGIAWSPGGKRSQVFRAGAGIFYDSTEIWYGQRQSSDPPFVDEVDNPAGCGTLSNPWLNFQFPLTVGSSQCSAATAGKNNNPFPGIQTFPSNSLWIVLPQNWKPEYVTEWNASYEIEFAKDWLFSAAYIGNKTTHASLGVDLNYAETNFANTSGNGSFCQSFSSAGCTTGNETARRVLAVAAAASGKPDLIASAAEVGQLITPDDGANANYNGLLLTLRHRFSHGFTLLSNYTWSHCFDYNEFQGDVAATAYVNQISRAADYGSCGSIDIRQILHNSLIVQSPYHGTGWKGQLLGHWQGSVAISAQSGLPINVTSGVDSSLTNEGSQRVNVIPGVDPYLDGSEITTGGNVGKFQFLNPAAFQQLNAAGTNCTTNPNCTLSGVLGNVGRDNLRAPGAINCDASISRIFDIHERLNMEFRAEAFNFINHWNPTAPGSGLNSTSFGTVGSAPPPGLIPSVYDPRVMQFALKFHW